MSDVAPTDNRVAPNRDRSVTWQGNICSPLNRTLIEDMSDRLLSTRQKAVATSKRTMTVRVHELAKNLGVSSAQVLELLRAMGHPAKGPSSSVEMSHADVVRRAFEATTSVSPELRPTDRLERVRERLHLTVSGTTWEAWLAEQALVRRVNVSRQEAAVKSRELYQADQFARGEADRGRWEGTFEGPLESKRRARAVVYQGGAPGLGKRH